ncbi:coenzyme Q-binding protein COQ10, mitochondrial isoform X1 [Drosophila innubila]|uniref:coenzyme Q-binding protein COQ10, mitochondrial isoform X1 n=2 Tax=Drosophila innubila TaxID=198719 RepID=UPI00148E3004|nr:coenzyme Q-binding protein COQ10, mitochondrial isoform X1 [Drosophila innubila]
MLKGSTLKALDVRILQRFIESSCQHQTSVRHHANGIQRTYITFNDLRNKSRSYTKKELVGYSMQDMYSVVADVSNYNKFVPYVKKSHVHSRDSGGFKADLIVGFPPLNEAYTSRVTLEPVSLVKSECHDGRLFNYLLNEWRFSPGLKDIPNSCVLDFKVAFRFKSLLHSNIANLFFDLICDQMENAFIQEVGRRSGPPSIRSHVLTSKRS